MISVDVLLDKLDDFPDKIAKKCKELMVEETPVGPTGNLRKSIEILEQDNTHAVIGTTLEYAYYVENGRGPIVANHTTRKGQLGKLHYFGYAPGPKSIHGRRFGAAGDPGVEYFRTSVGPADPNPFVEDTKKRIEQTNWVGVFNS